MSFIQARLGVALRRIAPSRPSLTGGNGNGGGGKASNAPARRVGEEDDEGKGHRSNAAAVTVAKAALFAAPLAASRPARAGPARPRASAAPSEGGLDK